MAPNPLIRTLVLVLGYGFLYIPILSLMVFSFNNSSMMTSWTGFSLKWYVALFQDQALLSAARLSLLIAGMTATASVIIGTWAGYDRLGRNQRTSRHNRDQRNQYRK